MRFVHKHKELIKRSIIIGLSGCILIICAGKYTVISTAPATTNQELLLPPVEESVTILSDSFIMRTMTKWNDLLDQMSESVLIFVNRKEEAEKKYIPSVLKYNLVSVFPEADVDNTDRISIGSILSNPAEFTDILLKPLYKKLDLPVRSKVSNSYGGLMYEMLNRKDAEWTANLYQWIQATPERAATMKALPVSSVTGGYNPQNPLHKIEDPNTWLIPSWKNVVVDFYNGDNQKIELYSNTQDILSLASVNTFGASWQDAGAFKNYIDQLWNVSHSYNTTISERYYCEGCENLIPVAVSTSESTVSGGFEPQTDVSPSGPSDGLKTAPVASKSTATPITVETAATSEVTASLTPAETSDAEMILPQTETATTVATHETTVPEATTQNPTVEENIPQETHPNETTSVSPEVHVNADGKFCPGHVDLIISAKIIGLSEKNNLFTVDRTHKSPWTPYMKAYVYQLFFQDWDKEYGLSAMNLGMGKPLTANEIAEYMSLLPTDTSPKRRAVVAYALNSVGKIPYYYGGKPFSTGYENNHFSSPRKPDQKGRILSGLDCSGWINWVYWSAIGEKLNSLGTSGLIHEGHGVNRTELKSGDILVKPGLNSHVVMFLAWAPDGSVICIHETGGTTNNVVVSTLSLDWPYYRAILD